jgi:hypothetical protein
LQLSLHTRRGNLDYRNEGQHRIIDRVCQTKDKTNKINKGIRIGLKTVDAIDGVDEIASGF